MESSRLVWAAEETLVYKQAIEEASKQIKQQKKGGSKQEMTGATHTSYGGTLPLTTWKSKMGIKALD